MHTMEKMDMLATKLDLLIKRLDKHDATKEITYDTVQALDSHMTCEVCGNTDTRGTAAPKPMKMC